MSSVLPLAAGIVAASERSLLTLGRAADKNSSGAVFAVRPPLATQDAEPDVPRSADAVVIPVEVAAKITAAGEPAAPQSAAAAYSAVAAAVGQVTQAAQAAAPNANAAAEAVPPPLAVANAVASSQAACAYAQMMQGWLETRPPRTAPARRPPPKAKDSPKR